VKTHVHRIREKLKASASEKTPAIVTIHAAGYMLKTGDSC
jgi:DNA-binding response OmpR family regulator